MIFNIADINEIKPLPMNDEEECAQVLKEVEKFELTKLLGRDFYEAINDATYNYTELIEKLKPCITYLFWATWTMQSQMKATFSGYEVHTTDYSQIPSTGALKNLSQTYREYASIEWENVKIYLNNHSDEYPLWKSCCKRGSTTRNGFSDFETVRKHYYKP
jgi:hypothetical protein